MSVPLRLAVLAAIIAAAVSLGCPSRWAPRSGTNLCYRVYKRKLKFTAAENACKRRGGRLAITRNVNANTFVQNEGKQKKVLTAWIGLKRDAKGSSASLPPPHWRNAGRTPLRKRSWKNWIGRTAPLGTGQNGDGETCFFMFFRDGKWGGGNCGISRPYVCETRATKGRPRGSG